MFHFKINGKLQNSPREIAENVGKNELHVHQEQPDVSKGTFNCLLKKN